MKMKTYGSLFAVLSLIGACQKEPVTKPVYFTETTYQNLGTFDDSGKPSYLLTPDAISTGMQTFIADMLPEKVNLGKAHPELLSSTAIDDITITKPSDITITYISHGTKYPNALAFYTYPTNNPPDSAKDIKTITYVFPNVGNGSTLKAGDKVKIGHFEVGTSIGFVLMQGAWNATTKTLDNNAVHFCSNDVLNPEVDPKLKKHAVLINYPAENKVLIGFEDINRTQKECDNDFNDIVLYATVTQ